MARELRRYLRRSFDHFGRGLGRDVAIAAGAGTGAVVGVASIIDRSAAKIDFGAPFTALAKIDIKTYKEGECPLCKSGIPITKPGSRTHSGK